MHLVHAYIYFQDIIEEDGGRVLVQEESLFHEGGAMPVPLILAMSQEIRHMIAPR